jgi:hypothetical protein
LALTTARYEWMSLIFIGINTRIYVQLQECNIRI